MKFRTKPVTKEAWQYDGKDGLTWPKWLHDYVNYDGAVAYFDRGFLFIPTKEGKMMASPGDWIIKGLKGELYPCKPDIFEATYEPVDDGDKDGG